MTYTLPEPKRRHHYVWCKYLRAWADNKKVFCLREGSIINPNITGIALRRDFYKMHTLTEYDLKYVRMMTIGNDQGFKREIHEMRIQSYIEASQLMNSAEIWGDESNDLPKLSQVIRSNFMEDAHSDVENQGSESLDCLLNGDITFIQESKKFIDFAIFLITQWLRTKKMRDLSVGINSPIKKDTLERTWTLISQMLAVNIANGIYTRMSEYSITMLNNETSLEFITSDQPVINTIKRGSVPAPYKLELFYPISPKTAIYFGNIQNTAQKKKSIFDHTEIQNLNDLVTSNSYAQIFSSRKETLMRYKIT